MDELYERRRNLQESIANYFRDGEIHYGDKGYQDLLAELVEVEMAISSDELDEISEIV